jgi:hypothetical protein
MQMRPNGLQKKLYRMTYDKPALHRKALQLQKSLAEVREILGSAKKNNSSSKN